MSARPDDAETPGGSFPPIVLIGPPGAGKTTVGTKLAALLRTGFTDTDAIVGAAAGKPVSDIFVQDGESEFRRLERDAVAVALTGGAGVIGLGGGAVMDPQTQARLAGQRVVYLETGFAELAKRVGLDRPRPLLIGTNPRAQLKALLDARLPVYDKLAWITVATDGREPAEIAAEIAEVVSGDGAAASDADGRAAP
jgi:shikimate kinase